MINFTIFKEKEGKGAELKSTPTFGSFKRESPRLEKKVFERDVEERTREESFGEQKLEWKRDRR
jgi:hypothetical protein